MVSGYGSGGRPRRPGRAQRGPIPTPEDTNPDRARTTAWDTGRANLEWGVSALR